MLLRNNFFGSSLFKYIVADFLSVAIGFVLASYILVVLGSRELGIFSLYLLLTGLYTSLAQGAANSYLMKYFFTQHRNSTLFSVNMTMFAFSLLALVVYGVTYSSFQSYYVSAYFIPFAIAKAFNSTPFVVMRLYEDAGSYLAFSLGYKVFYALVVLYLALVSQLDIGILITVLFYNEVTFLFLLYLYLYYRYDYYPSFDLLYFKENIMLSTKLFPHKVFKTFYENIDKYAVQILLGLNALGLYSMMTRLASPVSIFIKATNNEFAVIISKVTSQKESLERLVGLERKITSLLLLVNIGTVLLALGYHWYIYDLGESFYIVFTLLLMVMNGLLFYFAFYNLLFLQASKVILFVIGVNIMIFLGFIFLWRDSMVYIAGAFLLSNTMGNIILYTALGRENIFWVIKRLFLPYVLIVSFVLGGVLC